MTGRYEDDPRPGRAEGRRSSVEHRTPTSVTGADACTECAHDVAEHMEASPIARALASWAGSGGGSVVFVAECTHGTESER